MSVILSIWLNYNPKSCRNQSDKLLQRLLRYYTGSGNSLKILRTNNGKPFVEASISFSYTHSHGVYAYCFTKSGEVGLDIEKINIQRRFLSIASRFFHQHELDTLKKLPPSKQSAFFYQLWTAKEALCKYYGATLWPYLKENILPFMQYNMNQAVIHAEKPIIYCISDINGFSVSLAVKEPVKQVFVNRIV